MRERERPRGAGTVGRETSEGASKLPRQLSLARPHQAHSGTRQHHPHHHLRLESTDLGQRPPRLVAPSRALLASPLSPFGPSPGRPHLASHPHSRRLPHRQATPTSSTQPAPAPRLDSPRRPRPPSAVPPPPSSPARAECSSPRTLGPSHSLCTLLAPTLVQPSTPRPSRPSSPSSSAPPTTAVASPSSSRLRPPHRPPHALRPSVRPRPVSSISSVPLPARPRR